MLATILVAGVFISPDSFWIDEGNTAYRAMQPDLSSWFKALTSINGSDSQMPGYMLYVWVWQKFSGDSEFALRLSNLPWLALMVWALRRSPMAIVVALTSPFILYYLSELRPYLMQVSGAALVIHGFSRMEEHPASGWKRSLAGCLVMCASSLLGVVWSLGALIFVIIESPARLKCRWFWQSGLAFAPAFGVLAAYYAWTLAQGQGAALMGGGFVVSVAAASYELLGLAGLGPEKVRLRVDPKSLFEYAWILIPAALVTAGLILWSGYHWSSTVKRRKLPAVICGVGTPVLILLALVVLRDFRVLGRHLAPLAPLLVLLIAWAATPHPNPRQEQGKINQKAAQMMALLVIALGLASSLSLRFSARHLKDDYRGAAEIAKQAIQQQKPVIWVADRWTGYFYGLDENHSGWHPWRDSMPLPDLTGRETLLLTKPDIYDPKGGLRTLLEKQNFKATQSLPAFTIFESRLPPQAPK